MQGSSDIIKCYLYKVVTLYNIGGFNVTENKRKHFYIYILSCKKHQKAFYIWKVLILYLKSIKSLEMYLKALFSYELIAEESAKDFVSYSNPF